ncbi:hypothetical protein ZIOFF_065801 [Zingiber officinale]|uniref:UBC core domain-containing protein n=1 Tax=Zingiber officinale TaxID=94328 RepID=A0A8J5EXJ5_ZINOF|nr:hypothetical protein ZIOFF_065801 [Zingiber officinale]
MSSPSKRREMDLMKLMISDYQVEMLNDGIQEFLVDFHGPNDNAVPDTDQIVYYKPKDIATLYYSEEAFPMPDLGYSIKVFIREECGELEWNCQMLILTNLPQLALSGSVCLDVINQTWSPMFDLVNVFEVFLPQLLLYPNPSDPLNGEAAALMMQDKPAYEQKVKEYCQKYAKPEDVGNASDDKSSDDEELSEDDGGCDSSDEHVVGEPDL